MSNCIFSDHHLSTQQKEDQLGDTKTYMKTKKHTAEMKNSC